MQFHSNKNIRFNKTERFTLIGHLLQTTRILSILDSRGTTPLFWLRSGYIRLFLRKLVSHLTNSPNIRSPLDESVGYGLKLKSVDLVSKIYGKVSCRLKTQLKALNHPQKEMFWIRREIFRWILIGTLRSPTLVTYSRFHVKLLVLTLVNTKKEIAEPFK